MRIVRLYSEADGEQQKQYGKEAEDYTVGEALPNREGKIPRVALAGPGQKTAVDAPSQQELLCLDSGDVGVEPPKKQEKPADKRVAC